VVASSSSSRSSSRSSRSSNQESVVMWSVYCSVAGSAQSQCLCLKLQFPFSALKFSELRGKAKLNGTVRE